MGPAFPGNAVRFTGMLSRMAPVWAKAEAMRINVANVIEIKSLGISCCTSWSGAPNLYKPTLLRQRGKLNGRETDCT